MALTEALNPPLAATSSAGDKQSVVKRLLELLDSVSTSLDEQIIFINMIKPLAAAAWELVLAYPSSSTGPALLSALMERFSLEGMKAVSCSFSHALLWSWSAVQCSRV